MTYVCDTNFLLSNPHALDNYDVVIPSIVLREIENLERRKSDRILQFQIRQAKRIINELLETPGSTLTIDCSDLEMTINANFDSEYADNIILSYAIDHKMDLLTNDILLKLKAVAYGITVTTDKSKSDYVENKGFKVVTLTKEEIDTLFQNLDVNTYNLIKNEYLVIKDESGKPHDLLKWRGGYHVKVGGGLVDGFNSTQFKTKFTPRDVYQQMVIDSILNNQVTIVRGNAGSGKSMLSLYTAWKLVEDSGYKLLLFVNPTSAMDAQDIGYRKGDTFEKLMQSSVGSMLKSKFGSVDEIKHQIEVKKNLDILPMLDIRGFDTGEQKTILWIPEAQNLTSELMKLSLQRVTETCKVIIDGDFNAQVDKDIYSYDNGMKRVSEVFRGTPLFGEIELQKVYRSELADLADTL